MLTSKQSVCLVKRAVCNGGGGWLIKTCSVSYFHLNHCKRHYYANTSLLCSVIRGLCKSSWRRLDVGSAALKSFLSDLFSTASFLSCIIELVCLLWVIVSFFFLFCSSAFLMVCWRRGWIQKHWSLWVWSNRHSSLTRRLWKLKPNFCESQYMPYSQHNESVWSVKSASSLNVSHCTVSCSIISQYVNVPVNELVFYWM